ncbi:MAG: hypothetical protein ACD_28C00285G0005 [uncultured bacterium]|nr:MAG: hypothetical protein ACD_28C00285G0005 [uncultured bacterium]
MPFLVYMLECADRTLYVGSTNNLEKRLHQHNHLKSGATYTKGRRPVRVVYQETHATFREARQRECQIKCLTRAEKLKLVQRKSTI